MQHITIDNQTHTFLDLLWRGGKWAYWYLIDEQKTYTNAQGDQEPVKRSHWFPVGKTPKLPNEPTAHYYFCVNPSTERRSNVQRAVLDTVASIGSLFTEYDLVDWKSREAILDFIATLPRKPSVLIDSGGGYHAYWILDSPFIIQSDADRLHAKDISKRWVRLCEGDDVKDLTRVLRLPGSKNIKPKYAPDYPTVDYVWCELDVRYSLSDLVSLLPADEDESIAQNAPKRTESRRSELNGSGSVIDLYNADTTITAALERAGYTARGQRYCAPGADKSTNSSVVLLDDGYSYHWDSGDELADGHKHSAFDVYCHYEHGDNAKAAVTAFRLERGLIRDVEYVNGVACCPVHHTPLPQALNGNGFKCHQSTGKNEWCDFWWKGEGYAMPNSHTLTDSHESKTTLNLSPEDVITAKPTAAERSRFAPRPIDDLDAVAPPQWLLRDELVRGYNFLYGPSGSGKTFYAIDLAGRVATQIGTVVYVPTEDVGGLRIRTTAWRLAHEKQLPNFHWINAIREQIDLTNTRDVDDLIAALRPLSPTLTIIDTLAMAHTGDENNETYSMVNRAIQRIMFEVGTWILLVHHTGVNEGRERGGTALMGNVDIKLKVSNDDGLIRIRNEKIRNGIEPEPRVMRLTSVNTGIKDDDGNDILSAVIRPAADVTMRGAALTAQQKVILETLALEVFRVAGATGKSIMAQITSINPSSFYRTISILMDKGLVTQSKKGDPFYITDKGRDEIAPEYLEAPDPGRTPAGYEADSHSADPHADAQLPDSHRLASDSHSSNESQSPSPSTLSRPTPTHYSVGVGESRERDSQEKKDTPAQATASPVDIDYVRRMVALGTDGLAGLQFHLQHHSFGGTYPAVMESVLAHIDELDGFSQDE